MVDTDRVEEGDEKKLGVDANGKSRSISGGTIVERVPVAVREIAGVKTGVLVERLGVARSRVSEVGRKLVAEG